MHLNRSKDPSRIWLQCLGGVSWLIGAAMSAVWMIHGGGVVWPLAGFAVWATAVSFLMIRALGERSNRTQVTRQMLSAVRYGGYSVVGLALGTLFMEYWPVTVSMAFMFAICRTFKTEDTPAYI